MNRTSSFAMSLVLGIAFLAFSRSIGWALNKGFTFTLLSEYTNSSIIKGFVLAIEGFMGLIVPPLAGWYSDRIFTRAGRRKPFIISGGLMAGVSLYLIYFFYSHDYPFEAFIFMISFFYFSMHLYTAPFRALMPDLVGSGHRGRASGIITIFEVMGSLTGFIVGAILWNINELYPFIMGAFLIPIGSIATYTTIREKPLSENKKKEVRHESLIGYAKRMFYEGDVLKFYLAQTFWWMGFEFIAMFFVGIAAQILLGAPTEGNIDKVTSTAVILMGVFNIAAVFSALPGGYIYDRIGRKSSIIIGNAIFGISIFMGLLASSYVHILIILIIAGIGWGIILSSSYPVIGDLLTKFRREEYNGRYYGLFEASRSIPILLGGVLGGIIVFLSGNNYCSLFPTAGTFVLLAIPVVLWMHHLEEKKCL